MIGIKQLGTCWIWLVLIGLLLVPHNSSGDQRRIERLNLSVPYLKIQKEERIVEFRVSVFHGFVVAIPDIPPGWSVDVDLPYQWKTVLTAVRIIGAAGLTWEETAYFNNFLMIEKLTNQEEPLFIEVEIKTETYERGAGITTKRYLFPMKDLTLTSLPAKVKPRENHGKGKKEDILQ
jgi:hypothetical protein